MGQQYLGCGSSYAALGLGYGMMGGTGIGFIIMLLFWVIVILGITWLVRSLWHTGKEPKTSSALEILRERYAKGEISKEEFESKKKDII
ncbi:MAG: SHOCT domain-containing protein [Candidatus Kerfeldbacteria bacterium]|nr:SHOCT domain-containing protein [Candidatus Kerfeldbacteria bacterium]